jgi:hypothetical protein
LREIKTKKEVKMKSQAITDNFQDAAVDALAVVVFKDEKANSGILKDWIN